MDKKRRDNGNKSEDFHAKLKDRTNFEQSIVGLWSIRTNIGDDGGKIVSRADLANFIFEAFELKVDERSLERALKSTDAREFVINVHGVQFQITPSGMRLAESIIQ